MSATAEHCRKWRKRLFKRALIAVGALNLYGYHCMRCGSDYMLQFAHVRPTNLVGPSRSQYRRWLDVVRNPRSYVLLCKDCHIILDSQPHPGNIPF
jgi:hypothetical protein